MNADFIEQWKRDVAAAIKEYARVHQHAYRELPTSFSGWDSKRIWFSGSCSESFVTY